MNLVSDLGNDIAFAILVEKKYREKVDSKELIPLISNVRDALRTISERETKQSEIAMHTAGPLSWR
ncbi:MAG: hypothetical protein KDB79_08780 [Acidobacteria bacterium]|nr:hypothetical protein [Acidobacteriota bacterium]